MSPQSLKTFVTWHEAVHAKTKGTAVNNTTLEAKFRDCVHENWY